MRKVIQEDINLCAPTHLYTYTDTQSNTNNLIKKATTVDKTQQALSAVYKKPTYSCDMPQNHAFTSHLTAEAIEPEKQARRGARSRQHRNVFSSLYIS